MLRLGEKQELIIIKQVDFVKDTIIDCSVLLGTEDLIDSSGQFHNEFISENGFIEFPLFIYITNDTTGLSQDIYIQDMDKTNCSEELNLKKLDNGIIEELNRDLITKYINKIIVYEEEKVDVILKYERKIKGM